MQASFPMAIFDTLIFVDEWEREIVTLKYTLIHFPKFIKMTFNSNLQVGMRIQSNQLLQLSPLTKLFFQQSPCALKIPDQIVGEVSSKYLMNWTLIVDYKGETSIFSIQISLILFHTLFKCLKEKKKIVPSNLGPS